MGERNAGTLAENFALLVQDLARYAPQAWLNRGAADWRDRSPQPTRYPSKNAFFEEITWLLWRLRQARAE